MKVDNYPKSEASFVIGRIGQLLVRQFERQEHPSFSGRLVISHLCVGLSMLQSAAHYFLFVDFPTLGYAAASVGHSMRLGLVLAMLRESSALSFVDSLSNTEALARGFRQVTLSYFNDLRAPYPTTSITGDHRTGESAHINEQ